jgi:ribosome-associated protein
MLKVNSRIAVPEVELRFTFARSSGPGGQNVNKVATKAILRWSPARSAGVPPDVLERLLVHCASRMTAAGELVIACDRHRSQKRNATECLARLRDLLLLAARQPRPRKATKPTRASRARRKEAKLARARKKRDRRRRFED